MNNDTDWLVRVNCITPANPDVPDDEMDILGDLIRGTEPEAMKDIECELVAAQEVLMKITLGLGPLTPWGTDELVFSGKGQPPTDYLRLIEDPGLFLRPARTE